MKTRKTPNPNFQNTISTAALVRAAIGYKREIATLRRRRTQKLNKGIAFLFDLKLAKAAALDNEISCLTARINERILRVNFICKTLRERNR